MNAPSRIYGLLAEFDAPDVLLEAARRAREAGYTRMEAYTPFPVHGLAAELGFHHTRLPLIVLIGGIVGAVGGFFMQWYANVVSYPITIAGRPLNRLPQPYHPLFNIPRFELASRSAFFLSLQKRDPKFDLIETRRFLESLNPRAIYEVPVLAEPVAT